MSKKNHLPKKQKREKKLQFTFKPGTGICVETPTHSLCFQVVNLNEFTGFGGASGCSSDDQCPRNEVCGDHGTCENRR